MHTLRNCLCCQQTEDLCPDQQNTDLTTGHRKKNIAFSKNLPSSAGDPDKGQSPVFSNTEALSTIQKQDIVATGSFSIPADSLLQQASQQFLLEPREGLSQERPGSSSGAVGRLCGETAHQQQQLSLFPPDEVAQLEEAVRQLKAKGFCSLPLQSDGSMAKKQQQQQQHIQHQQQIQQHQQQQIQEHQIQQQIQQHQHQQVLESLQQQLFRSQIQMQCSMFQDASQGKNTEQQSSSQGVVPNQGSLFQQPQQQQQQQTALFQQANDLLSIQTEFLQQTPSHPSPPMFHNPSPLGDAPDSQVQAALFQNTLTVLQSPEQQPSTPGHFLPQASLTTQLTTNSSQHQHQQQQQQQLAFLSSLQAPAPEPPSVFQSQTQLSPIQQRSPMEQQQSGQLQPHTQPSQQASLFQNMSSHSSVNTLSPGQQQQQQTGLLFCSSPLSTPDQASSLLYSSQGQMPPLTSSSLVPQEPQNPSMLFSQASLVPVNQQDRSEPMTLGNPSDPRQQVMFQEQQPMQLGSSSNSQEQPVGLFMPQSSIASLQGGLAQELAQSAMFASQNGMASLQTTTSSPVQQPGALFQTTVSGAIGQSSQPQQPDLFIFGMQNGKTFLTQKSTSSDT